MPHFVIVKPGGEWQRMPAWEGLQFGCCDCGLVHTVDIRAPDYPGSDELEIRIVRNEEMTTILRQRRQTGRE